MTTKVDQLIEKFKEFKEELSKGVNESSVPTGNGDMAKMVRAPPVEPDHSPAVMTSKSDCGMDMMAMSEKEKLTLHKNGQWSLDKSAFKKLQHKIEEEGHSKESAGAITASIGRKAIGEKAMEERSKAGMKKEESKKDGTNQRIANPPEGALTDGRGKVHMVKDEHPTAHNTEEFKVMPMTSEKDSKKAKVKGEPYNGKDVKKGDHGKPVQGNEARGNDENKAPGRGTLGV